MQTGSFQQTAIIDKPFHVPKIATFVYFLLSILTFLAINSAFADMGESQYKAAQMPNTESCTVGRDLLSDEAEYDKTDITGALPYSRHYETTLTYNFNRVSDMTDGQKSIGGWTDNYNNYVFVEAAGDGKNAIMRLRLPGDKDDTYYILNLGTNTVQRIFSSTPQVFEGSYIGTGNGNYIYGDGSGDRTGTISTNHRDRQLVMYSVSTADLKKLSFYVNNHGIIYQFQYQASVVGTPTAVYKMIRVIYPDGRVLGLSYENYGGIGLISVADNRGHLLTLQRNLYMDGNAVRSVVNSVTLTAQTQNGYAAFPDQQQVTYQYKVSNWTNFNDGLNERFYTISSATSNLYGTETYQYNQNAALSTAQTGTQAHPTNYYTSQYQVPVLTDVVNSASVTQLHWDYVVPSTGSGWTMLLDSYRPFSPVNVFSTTRNYTGGVSNPGSWSANYSFTTIAKIDGTTSSGNIAESGSPYSSQVTYNFSGFPCITYNKIPVSSETMDVVYNNVTDIYDMNGNHTHFTYDSLNRVATVEEAVGTAQDRTTTYTYGNLNTGALNTYLTPTVIQNPYQTITNTLNTRGQILSQTKNSSQGGSVAKTVSYAYFEDPTQSNYGLLSTYAGPRSASGQIDDHIWYSYDSYGNLNDYSPMINGAVNGVRYRNYNSAGLPSTASYSDGTMDTMTYDSGYHLLTKVHGNSSLSQITSNTYDGLGRLITSTDADGHLTRYDYDGIGRLFHKIFPNGNMEKYVYNSNNVLYATDKISAAGIRIATNIQEVDSAGRVAFTIQGVDGSRMSTSISYDANGNVIQTTTSQGITNKWSYDALNRVISHTDGNGKVDTKAYDAIDNNASERSATNVGSGRSFVDGRLLSIDNNDDYGKKSYYYDLSDNLGALYHVFRTCNYGLIDQIGRSPQNYCTAISGNSDSNFVVNDQYTYDKSAYGNLDQVVSNTVNGVSTYYTYDLFHRVKSKTQINQRLSANGTSASQKSVSYSYTTNGSMTNLTYPSGNRIDYNYDNNGVINNIQLNNQPLIKNINFDGANRLSSFDWGQGGTWQQLLSDDGLNHQVSSSTSNSSAFFETYQYDLDGRMLSKQLNNGNTYNYSFDNNSQLKSESISGVYAVGYNYDDNGNRTQLNSSGSSGYGASTVSFTYPWANHLGTWSKNGTSQTITYGGTGVLVNTYKGWADYDYANRRKQESAVPGSNTYVGQYFEYNYKNERTLRGGSGIDRQYVYDESSHLIGEYSVTGALIVEYVWFGDRPIAAIYPNNRIIYLVTDYQNKPRRGIDAATQQIVWAWDPDAFGVTQPTGSVQMNLRFPGQYYDEQSGLYYNHNRYYNPELGRYMEPDPLGLTPGLNPYAYAGNDPVNKTDPTGLDSVQQNINAGAMRAAANGNYLGVAAWSAASAVWTLGGAESISLAVAGESTSSVGIGFEALGALPGFGEVKGAVKAGETFFHYTDEAGAKAIKESGILQPNSRGQVFLTKDKLSPSEVKDRLFLGRSGDKGSHVVEVNMREGAAIEPGKNTNEFIHQGAIRDGRQGDIQRVSQNGF